LPEFLYLFHSQVAGEVLFILKMSLLNGSDTKSQKPHALMSLPSLPLPRAAVFASHIEGFVVN
jgi:hypothetical protein